MSKSLIIDNCLTEIRISSLNLKIVKTVGCPGPNRGGNCEDDVAG